MGEALTRRRNLDFYVKEEATEGTLIAHAGADAVKLRQDDLSLNLNRELLGSSYLNGTLGASAPQAGMWADDLGGAFGFELRGGASNPQPDMNVFLKCLFGSENAQAADTAVTGTLTTDAFDVATPAEFTAGNLLRIQTDTNVFSYARVLAVGAPTLTVWPPTLETPVNLDPIKAAYSYVLADTGHPTCSVYMFGEGTKRLAYAGVRPRTMSMDFTVGQRIPIIFTFSGLTPTFDYTADGQTPVYQSSPEPLIALGMTMAFTYADTVTGTPTTIETVISTPYHEVAVGDYLCVDVGAGVYEWQAITGVTGDAGDSTITLDHAAFGSAATATETCYVKRVANCAQAGEGFDMTMEYEWLPVNCITEAYGKKASLYGNRTINFNFQKHFRSWQEYYKRDNVVRVELLAVAGNTANNIAVIYCPSLVNTDSQLTFDELMMNPTAMQAVRGTMTNNKSEMTLAFFG